MYGYSIHFDHYGLFDLCCLLVFTHVNSADLFRLLDFFFLLQNGACTKFKTKLFGEI